MELSSIINQYYDAYINKYADIALPGHLKAMNAIRCCRTPNSGELYVQCPNCNHGQWYPLSCGHRSCPTCQNHAVSQWIDRQQGKLLPVPYFLATFTLPYELRSLTWCRAAVWIRAGANGKRKRGNIFLMNLPWQRFFAPGFWQL